MNNKTQKTIISQTEPINGIKLLRELNLTDDFMFDVTTNNLECCQIILELALGIRIKTIRWHENQKVIHNMPGKQLTVRCDKRLRRLHEIIESIRSNSEVEAYYMKSITREQEIIADAKAEERACSVLVLLDELGEIPDNLRTQILNEQDLNVLRTWLITASKARTIHEFTNKIF